MDSETGQPMTERWCDISGWGGAYRISDRGRVAGVARRCRVRNRYGEYTRRVPAKVLRPQFNRSRGVLTVQLCRDGQPETRDIATLVLEAWVGP
jgi:hypothetical protein